MPAPTLLTPTHQATLPRAHRYSLRPAQPRERGQNSSTCVTWRNFCLSLFCHGKGREPQAGLLAALSERQHSQSISALSLLQLFERLSQAHKPNPPPRDRSLKISAPANRASHFLVRRFQRRPQSPSCGREVELMTGRFRGPAGPAVPPGLPARQAQRFGTGPCCQGREAPWVRREQR